MSETGEKTGMRRWVRGVLFLSLALNLAVIGLVIGMIASEGPPGRKGHHSGPDAVIPFTRALNEDQRRALRRDLRDAYFKGRDAKRPSLTEGYQDALEVLRSEPLDAERLNAVLDDQNRQADERRKGGQRVLSRYLAAMTPEERARYADRLEAEIERLSQRRKHWRKE